MEALKGLGFDHAFNYKTTTVDAALSKYAPEGIDVYWDNVGGETLDAVLPKMKRKGRIVACGSISQYHVLGSDKACKSSSHPPTHPPTSSSSIHTSSLFLYPPNHPPTHLSPIHTDGLKNYFHVVTNTLKWEGFLAFDYTARAPELFAKLGALLQQGKIKPVETIIEGLEKVPEAFIGLFKGENLVRPSPPTHLLTMTSFPSARLPTHPLKQKKTGQDAD